MLIKDTNIKLLVAGTRAWPGFKSAVTISIEHSTLKLPYMNTSYTYLYMRTDRPTKSLTTPNITAH
jgi:hypothetical protein